MEKFKFTYRNDNDDEIKKDIKANSDCLSLIDELGIDDLELANNLNMLFEYKNDLKPCINCMTYLACNHSPKGMRMQIKRDMDGNLTNSLAICPKYAEYYKKINNIVYSTYNNEDVVDEKNLAILKNLIVSKDVSFSKNIKDGIKCVLKNEKINGLYIKMVDSKSRKAISLGLANSFLKNNKVSICSFPSLVRNLKLEFGKFDQDLFDKVKESSVVILTDVGSESINSFSRDDVLLNLLDYRLQNSLATILINSYELEELKKLYKLNYNDGLKADLVVEKIKEIIGE